MSTNATLREIGRALDDPASLGRAVDDLLAARPEPPALLALGEPTHGIAAFPLLRNELLGHLVARGYRWIALETDILAAAAIDDYVTGAPTDLDAVLATGFSHGFGAVPGNRELVEWLREYNTERTPQDRIRCYGFDAPVEYAGAPSPRHALAQVRDYLPAALRPGSIRDLDPLLGDDADWTNPAAMADPAASIGDSGRARALRVIADDLADALHHAASTLRSADATGYDHAVTHARTGRGLLRYHAAMADRGADRIAALLGLRAEMMAENLLALVAGEQHRGPGLVFAHNAHLRRATSPPDHPRWTNAGTLVARALGDRYVFLATDADPHSDPGTLQAVLAGVTTRRALFPAPALRAALDPAVSAGTSIVPGHIPLGPADLECADAVIFIADTDGQRYQYW